MIHGDSRRIAAWLCGRDAVNVSSLQRDYAIHVPIDFAGAHRVAALRQIIAAICVIASDHSPGKAVNAGFRKVGMAVALLGTGKTNATDNETATFCTSRDRIKAASPSQPGAVIEYRACRYAELQGA